MSIIEKAAHRLDQERQAERAPAATPAAAPGAGATPTQAAQAAPAAAAPAAAPAPVAPFHAPHVHTPAAEAGTSRTREVELDLARMNRIGILTADGGRSSLVEDLRSIKRPLLKTAFAPTRPGQNPANLVMITSSLPGEGKTYCSINMAMSIAMELDHTVLLVDADVARPSVMSTLGLHNQQGLMDLLLNEKQDMADVLLRTNVPQLTILPAGRTNARATELLASHAMTTLVQEMASRYSDRIIIFDSPPLLLTSEAHVLASHMGQIVVIVEAEKTTQHALKESLRQLEGCPNVNLVYNKSRKMTGVESYDYHYGA